MGNNNLDRCRRYYNYLEQFFIDFWNHRLNVLNELKLIAHKMMS